MDADDRALLAASVAGALRPHAAADTTDAALASVGWADMLDAEPTAAVAVVFEQLGRTNATTSALDDVVTHHLGLPLGVALVHPRWGDAQPTESGGRARLDVEGTAGARIKTAPWAHFLQADGVARVATDVLEISAPRADEQLARVVAVGADVTDWSPLPSEIVAGAVSAARLALGHQLHGLAATMLALARDHAAERIQFGRPIGSFQAVRHKLAETHVAVEAAGDALAAADDDPAPIVVDLARVLAGRAARDAGRHGQQVLAGIGFTRDHDFHRYLFTSLEIDGLYGTTPSLVTTLGHQLLAAGAVPRVVDL